MSNMKDRRQSPRREVQPHYNIAGRICIMMYSSLPFITFIGCGDWRALVATLAMQAWGLRPINRGFF